MLFLQAEPFPVVDPLSNSSIRAKFCVSAPTVSSFSTEKGGRERAVNRPNRRGSSDARIVASRAPFAEAASVYGTRNAAIIAPRHRFLFKLTRSSRFFCRDSRRFIGDSRLY
jgi:hypothetical protein